MGVTKFLESRGFFFTPEGGKEYNGYITPLQKEQFTKRLQKYPNIQKVAEIGFNAGHSAEHFFNQCPSLKLFAAFDLNRFPCTKHAAEFFYEKYPDRFVFIPGDSLISVPEMHRKFPNIKFDLIYIDGCHIFEWALGDILNAKKLAHEKTIIWIDDLKMNGVSGAVKFCETTGVIQIEEIFSSEDPSFGPRVWAEATFL